MSSPIKSLFQKFPVVDGIPSSGGFPGLDSLQQSLNDFNSDGDGGGGIMAVFNVLVIIFKYPLKFFLLYYFFVIIFYLFQKLYLFACKAFSNIIKFFKILIKPKNIKIGSFKIYDIFRLFGGFMNFFIGLIYLCISILIFIAMVVLTIPFNMVLVW